MRPSVFQVGGTLYWVIQTRNPDTMILKDADSDPTVAVRKNGAAVGDSVTVTKRSATTGIYDCSYNPASEVEGDSFTFEEYATVTGTTTSSATYVNQFSVRVIAVERGTDSANTTTPPTAASIADQVWDEARADHDTAGTFGEKVNAELDSATEAKIDGILEDTGTTLPAQISGISGGGGGDATAENQEEIKALITGSTVIQVASPNVQGNLVLTQGDDYDGVANPKASWTVTTDYTSGWTVRLTIRDADDAVVYTNTGSVVSATVVAVTIAAPTGLEMTGCPGQWQGKFDVELTHSTGKKKTIALGVCYINEDQTRT
jgi:hypothetical protein